MYYKLARPDGWDFHTGQTINYRDNIGKTVICPKYNKAKGLCSSGVIHASRNVLDCFQGNTTIPCSAYRVTGRPIIGGIKKSGFKSLKIIEEVMNLDVLFGFKYQEAINPINPLGQSVLVNPFSINPPDIGNAAGNPSLILDLLRQWALVRNSIWESVGNYVWESVRNSVGNSIWESVRNPVGNSVGNSVRNSVGNSVWESVRNSVGNSIWESVRNSVGDSVWAYIGSLFPNITKWQYIDHEKGIYPFQPAVDLWRIGIVPSFDSKLWRLHGGENAAILWEGNF